MISAGFVYLIILLIKRINSKLKFLILYKIQIKNS